MLAAAPALGYLQVSEARPGFHNGQRNAPLLATLYGEGDRMPEVFPPLDYARVLIKRDALLIVGQQEIRRFGRGYDVFPQSWWCRPVLKQ